MINTSETLLIELENQLAIINRQQVDNLQRCREAIDKIGDSIMKLRELVLSRDFTNQQQEIHFFKSLKPRFSAWLIYYKKIYEIELSKPHGDRDMINRHYQRQMKKLNKYNEENNQLLQYLRSGSTHHDAVYFTRKKPTPDLYLNTFFFEVEPRFITNYDYKVARLQANERLYQYLLTRIRESEENPSRKKPEQNPNSDSPWSGTTTELTEMLYMLHNAGLLFKGADLTRSAQFIEETFGINLGQYRRTYTEIRGRKMDRTKLNDKMAKSFLSGMEAADNKQDQKRKPIKPRN